MKIVCDSCQAKYSIADEKVQGKAFKIRCKKCNHIIVVKSGAAESPAAAPAPAPEPQPAPPAAEPQGVWHIVVEGEQVGPLGEDDIKGRLSRGEINGETLVWKEGFADWVKLSTVPELADGAGARPEHSKPGSAESAVTPQPVRVTPVSHPRSTPLKEMPAAAHTPVADVFGAPATVVSGAQADLFAASAPTPAAAQSPTAPSPFSFGGPDPAAPASASPTPGNGAAHLTGQRNENSVLFSLSNLEALAVPTQGAGVRQPSSTTTTEGSGLIDIRSMAATVGGASGADAHSSSMDSLPTFSTPQFSALPPVLQSMPSGGPPKWLYPALGVVGLAVIGLGFGIYKVVSAPPPPIVVAPPPMPAPAAPAVAAPVVAKAPVAPAAPAPAPTAEEKPAPEKAARAEVHAEKKSKPSKGSSKSSPAPKVASAPEPSKPEPKKAAPEPSKPAKGGGSIDDLLDQVGSGKRAPAEADKPKKAAPASVALVSLSQSDIVKAMQAVQPKVKQCYNQYKVAGTALAQVSVAKGGRVAAVSVGGKFAGTPTGSCVEAATRSAKFPPCESMSFPWPFQLR